jgi:hypothetical protein
VLLFPPFSHFLVYGTQQALQAVECAEPDVGQWLRKMVSMQPADRPTTTELIKAFKQLRKLQHSQPSRSRQLTINATLHTDKYGIVTSKKSFADG